MTDLSKRSIVKMVALTAVATAALVGCGKKEEAPKAEAPAAAPAKAEPLKIAFAYVGPVGDGGWTFAHDNGRKEIEKAFGEFIKALGSMPAPEPREKAPPKNPDSRW